MNKDNRWRPLDSIRGKVIALIQHQNRLLVCEVLNDEGALKGWCPIGGGIEFGETAKQALAREIEEELGSTIQITGPALVFENIFEHHGVKGHEIIFAFPITLDKKDLYSQTRFQISESKGSTHFVEWVSIEHFQKEKEILFPTELLQRLQELQ